MSYKVLSPIYVIVSSSGQSGLWNFFQLMSKFYSVLGPVSSGSGTTFNVSQIGESTLFFRHVRLRELTKFPYKIQNNMLVVAQTQMPRHTQPNKVILGSTTDMQNKDFSLSSTLRLLRGSKNALCLELTSYYSRCRVFHHWTNSLLSPFTIHWLTVKLTKGLTLQRFDLKKRKYEQISIHEPFSMRIF